MNNWSILVRELDIRNSDWINFFKSHWRDLIWKLSF